MAIFSTVPPPEQQAPELIATLQSLTIGEKVTLSIPLDEKAEKRADGYKARKEPLRRDSLKRREALLKGKEGSRRRQRWENDHLLHVPNAQPPLPSDWEVRPTYPVHTVPYYLAPLWDSGVRRRAEEIATAKKQATLKKSGVQEQKGRVPQELRQKLKKAKGAKTLLQELEEDVRKFVREWERKMAEGQEVEMDSEDEEIVFVGRNGTMSDEQRKTVEEELKREKLVFDSLADDHGASFGRWLVHSIAAYYGLSSRSVTVGNPARREAYVGIKGAKTGRHVTEIQGELPRPLWGMI
ncbi:R3H-associated N-terminal domain-containing protein [Bisporella sp. PMI_857]|nr:R3H-associated N-terminal domain-containing protein [Bisporella sp. PMI_857]